MDTTTDYQELKSLLQEAILKIDKLHELNEEIYKATKYEAVQGLGKRVFKDYEIK